MRIERNLIPFVLRSEAAGSSSSIAVMHLTDSLSAGGLERMAVNLANSLPRPAFQAYLCTTRAEGQLEALVGAEVGRLRLRRRGRLDLGALRRLTRYLRRNRIQILHAHGTSLFLAVVASFFAPRPRVIWHDHFGRYATERRPVWLYRLAAARVSGVIAVNEPLAEWSRQRLRVAANRVWYIPNFVTGESSPGEQSPTLPGQSGSRIVCVANLRPQKGHPDLIRAMKEIVKQVPHAHLLLLGQESDAAYRKSIQKEIAGSGLSSHISWLGSRNDVAGILRCCDIGVLSSVSEGLPLALIEYGNAGLPAVATRVGQCAEVLDDGAAGILVPPSSPTELAEGIVSLLNSPETRRCLGSRLRERVREVYSGDRAIEQVCRVYEAVLQSGAPSTS